MDFRRRHGLRPVINVSGTMTGLGASIAVVPVIEAIAEVLPEFVEIDDLQRRASAVIAAACGSEAGYVTASCSAAITLTIAKPWRVSPTMRPRRSRRGGSSAGYGVGWSPGRCSV